MYAVIIQLVFQDRDSYLLFYYINFAKYSVTYKEICLDYFPSPDYPENLSFSLKMTLFAVS